MGVVKDVFSSFLTKPPKAPSKAGFISKVIRKKGFGDMLVFVPLEPQNSSRARHELRQSIEVYLMGPHLKSQGL